MLRARTGAMTHLADPNFAWIRRNMPRTEAACARLPNMQGVRLAYAGHLEPKMVAALSTCRARGAEVLAITCNPATVRADTVARLRAEGIEVAADSGMTESDYRQSIVRALDWQPTHTCEMGADLSGHPERPGSIRGALEATGSGISRLTSAGPLHYPVFNWDDLPIKEGLHNRHMVGLSTWHAFMQRTHLSLHEKHVVVVGFGPVGEGVADKARAFGAQVSVVDTDPARRIRAAYAGWPTGDLLDLCARADVLVTATGAAGTIGAEVLRALRPQCFLLNVGHRVDEIDLGAFEARRPLIPFVEACTIGGREVLLFSGGYMANLTAGFGDSLNAFDVTAATMTEAIGFVVSVPDGGYQPGVHPLPRSVWLRVLKAPGESSSNTLSRPAS